MGVKGGRWNWQVAGLDRYEELDGVEHPTPCELIEVLPSKGIEVQGGMIDLHGRKKKTFSKIL